MWCKSKETNKLSQSLKNLRNSGQIIQIILKMSSGIFFFLVNIEKKENRTIFQINTQCYLRFRTVSY